MAFINEHISQEDVIKFDLEAIDKKFIVGGTNARDWTIDRAQDMYLRIVTRGREEYSGQSGWTFYLRGEWVYLELCLIGGASKKGQPGWAHWKLLRIELPEHLNNTRAEILAGLKQALIAYKDGGVYATCTDYEVILDV